MISAYSLSDDCWRVYVYWGALNYHTLRRLAPRFGTKEQADGFIRERLVNTLSPEYLFDDGHEPVGRRRGPLSLVHSHSARSNRYDWYSNGRHRS